MGFESLSTMLREKTEILSLRQRADGTGWELVRAKAAWAAVKQEGKRTVFSPNAVSAKRAALVMRPGGCTLRQLIRWRGITLLPTDIVTPESRDRIEIRAAEVRITDCRAEPQKRTGRDDMNRPVAVEIPAFTFPGVLSEVYHRNEDEEIYRSDFTRRVLVTDPAIRLRPGDLVRIGEEAPYTVRTVGDLDPDRTEYLIERECDV